MRALLLACLLVGASAWVNKEVTRKMDASNAIVRTTITIHALNDASSAQSEYLFALPASNFSSIAMLKASYKGANGYTQVKYDRVEEKGDNVIFKMHLAPAVASNEVGYIKLRVSLADALRPLPASVRQAENQRVDFNDNAYFLSPYTTKTQTTTVTLASPAVDSFSKETSPVAHSGSTITYGPYKDVKPLSGAPLRFHGVNNKAFCKATSLKRVFEVSMWGNLAVEEWYRIEHNGAKLKGTFSRLDYAKPGGKTAPSSFTTLTARLPAAAQDIYFRDDIGNISTSTVGYAKELEKGTREVQFTQRFPLFGGWKTRFYFGYNLPLQFSMASSGSVNKLKVPYASPIKDLFVEDMTVEVILPEGVPTPEVTLGGSPVEFTVEKRATYLDYSGRTVVVLKDKLLASPERSEELEITFTFGSADLVWEPFYLVTSFMVLFLSIIAFTKLN